MTVIRRMEAKHRSQVHSFHEHGLGQTDELQESPARLALEFKRKQPLRRLYPGEPLPGGSPSKEGARLWWLLDWAEPEQGAGG